MAQAYPGNATTEMGEKMACDHFLSALNNRDFELKIRERFPTSLDGAFKLAVQLEALQERGNAAAASDPKRGLKAGHRDEGLARRVAQLERQAVKALQERGKSL